MYATNTFLRIANFAARSFIGIVAGYLIGYFMGSKGLALSDILSSIGL